MISSSSEKMKVICANTGDKLPPKYFSVGYSTSTIFHLVVGKQYVVYGIALWRGLLSYLIVGEYDRPEWCPSDIFEVTNARLPPTWHFAFFGQDEDTWVNAIWGYEELTHPQHYDQLVNVEKSALEVFEMHRKATDELLDSID
jgi:hypothetical protein